MSYPVYVKPVKVSKGGGVYQAQSDAEVEEVLLGYEEERKRVAVIEEAIPLSDFRLVVLDGELISAYERVPLTVHGNGRYPIATLLE